MKLEKGDVVYNSETDELGYVCAVHKQRGCETSYNIVWDEGFGFVYLQCSVYLFIEESIVLISKGDFK